MKEIVTEIGDKMKVIKIDVDKNQRIAIQYNIQGVPTLMLFKNGIVIWRQSGFAGKEQLKKILSSYI